MSAALPFAATSANRRELNEFVALIAIVALLWPLAASVAGIDLAGWRPDHGHLTRSGVVPEHAHPYDHAHEHHTHSPAAGDEGSNVVFTFDEHAHGVTGPIPLLAAGVDVTPIDALPVNRLALPDLQHPRQPVIEVATPPPRS